MSRCREEAGRGADAAPRPRCAHILPLPAPWASPGIDRFPALSLSTRCYVLFAAEATSHTCLPHVLSECFVLLWMLWSVGTLISEVPEGLVRLR